MLRIVLVTPGATEYDQQGRIQGNLDIPLCADGREQVAEVISQLGEFKPEAVYASPCESCEQTATELGAAFDLRAKTVDKLANLDHGLWQGMLIEDVKTKQPKVFRQWREQPETVCPPQGETVQSAEERVSDVLRRVLKKHKSHDSVVLVVPEPLASLVRHLLRQDALTDFWGSEPGHASWEAIEAPAAIRDA